MAEQKRKQTTEERKNKLRQHLARVESISKQQAAVRKTSTEKLKSDIENKLEKASGMRENQLEKVKSIAHYSAEKKKSLSGNAYLQHENITLPAHSTNQPSTEIGGGTSSSMTSGTTPTSTTGKKWETLL